MKKQCAYCDAEQDDIDLRPLGRNEALDVIHDKDAVVCIEPNACIIRMDWVLCECSSVRSVS